MSFFSDLKNTDLVAFIGKDGVAILSKALEQVFAETDFVASDLAKSLHLKSRCLMAWLDLAKSNGLSRIPLTATITDSFVKDSVVAFTDKTAIISNRECTKFKKSHEIVETIENYTLPQVAAKILTLPQYEDEVNSNSSFRNLPALDKTIQSLVKRHLDFLKTSHQLRLNKSEGMAKCPDCEEYIKVSETGANLCICYKLFKNNSIHVMKNNAGGLTLHFGKNWNKENIALFSQALKNKLK